MYRILSEVAFWLWFTYLIMQGFFLLSIRSSLQVSFAYFFPPNRLSWCKRASQLAMSKFLLPRRRLTKHSTKFRYFYVVQKRRSEDFGAKKLPNVQTGQQLAPPKITKFVREGQSLIGASKLSASTLLSYLEHKTYFKFGVKAGVLLFLDDPICIFVKLVFFYFQFILSPKEKGADASVFCLFAMQSNLRMFTWQPDVHPDQAFHKFRVTIFISMFCQNVNCPTDPFTIIELNHPAIEELYVAPQRRSPRF